MKLFNAEFKKALKGYKAVKTICKGAKVAVLENEMIIQNDKIEGCDEDIEVCFLLNDTDAEEYHLDEHTISLMEKCKDDFTITKDTIKSGTRKISYVCNLETDPIIDTSQFKQIAEISQKALSLCLNGVKFSTSKDIVRPVLTNILWNKDKFVATDTYRVTTKNSPINIDMPVLLTKTAYTLLDKLLDKKSDSPVKVLLDLDHSDKRHVTFTFDNVIITTNVGKGEFLQYKRCFDVEATVECEVNRLDLIEKLEFMTYEKNPVKLTIDANIKLLTNTSTNVLEDEVDVRNLYKKQALTVAFNAKYLVESLKNAIGEYVKLEFTTNVAPLIITHDTGKDLVLPVRVNS